MIDLSIRAALFGFRAGLSTTNAVVKFLNVVYDCINENKGKIKWVFTLASTAVVLSEHYLHPGFEPGSPSATASSDTTRPPRWCLSICLHSKIIDTLICLHLKI